MPTNRLRATRATLLGGLIVAAAIPLAPRPAAASSHAVQVVLRGSTTGGGDLPKGTRDAVISADGMWLGFADASPGGYGYVKSLLSGATGLVTLSDTGTPANAPVTIVGVADGGSLVAFETAATNLGEGPATTNDLYLRNIPFHTTYRLNRAVGGNGWLPVKPGESTMSADNSTIAFTSTDNHVYAHAWYDNVTDQLDVSSGSVSGSGGAKEPSLSADGRYATFTSLASNLVAADTNFAFDVFKRDRQAKTTGRVSVSGGGAQLNLGSGQSSISGDGRYVAFTSEATNVLAGDTNDSTDVFRRDTTGAQGTLLVSGKGAAWGTNDSSHGDLNANGSVATFESKAENFDVFAKNGKADVFVKSLVNGSFVQAGSVAGSVPSQGSHDPSISADGTAVAYDSSSLISYPDQNQSSDAFVERADWIGPFTQYGPLVNRMVADFDAGFDSAGTYQATHRLIGGRTTPSTLILELAHAPAWAKDREPVIRLYEAFFHRQPDLGGLSYWIKKRKAGAKLGVIAANFAGSPEFETTYGNLSNSAFVSLVYTNVLHRSADAAGLAHWVGKMATGMSRGDVMVAFSESSEGKRRLSVPVDATLVGLGLFGGALPPKDLYDDAVHAAGDRGENGWIITTYFESKEYDALIAP